jgi:acetyltransferase-like isoleucine patch superfamily enzyme
MIGNDCLIMGNCHVAHDCDVGNNVIMAQTATIGGHVKVGDFAFPWWPLRAFTSMVASAAIPSSGHRR